MFITMILMCDFFFFQAEDGIRDVAVTGVQTCALPISFTIRRIVKAVGSEVPVLGFAGAPWTLACYMVEGRTKEGFATVKQFLYQEPKTFRDLLHRIAQATIPYLKAQIAAGATAVQLFDTWCGELSLQDYQESALPAVEEVVSGISRSVPFIYYTKASRHLLRAASRSGATVLSVDWRVDLGEIRGALGPNIALQGNVDPAVLLGPRERIREVTLDAIHSLAGRGHILNLGHGILPDTDRKSTRLNSSHGYISYAVFCLKKKKMGRSTANASSVARSRPQWMSTEAWVSVRSTSTECDPHSRRCSTVSRATRANSGASPCY